MDEPVFPRIVTDLAYRRAQILDRMRELGVDPDARHPNIGGIDRHTASTGHLVLHLADADANALLAAAAMWEVWARTYRDLATYAREQLAWTEAEGVEGVEAIAAFLASQAVDITPGGLIPEPARCCDLHIEPPGRCCDPIDCGPCCPNCPTCPEVNGGGL